VQINSLPREGGGPPSTCALFPLQCKGSAAGWLGGGCGTCALLTYCSSSFPAGRGLPSACALFLQHCRGYFAAALVWHLPESSRAGLGWAGLGGEGGAGAGGIVRSFVLSFSAPAPPSAGAHNPQVFFFFPVTAPTGCNRNRAA
jgi:hypothetical protein